MQKFILSIFIVCSLFSCQENKNKNYNLQSIKSVPAKGYVVPKDSMRLPKILYLNKTKLNKIAAGKPSVVIINNNAKPIGQPKVVMVGKPIIAIPGQDSFSLPKTVPAIGVTKLAGIPEMILVKDMANKDQNPHNFSTFGKLQGLKHGNVTCILEDKTGNLWFGTYGGGISKYDGKYFSTYSSADNIANNTIMCALQDKKGNIWFGTFTGVSKFDGKYFTNYSDKDGLVHNTVIAMTEDKNGNIWFGTDGGGVSKFDGKSFTNFTEKEGLINNTVQSILEDKEGNVWFGTDGGLSRYNGNCVDDIINRTNLYQHTPQELKKNKKDFVKSFSSYTDKEGLANNHITCILEDKLGNIWFGTDGAGITKYDKKFFNTFTDKEGFASNSVKSILQDKKGNIWFGTNGRGLCKYDGKYFSTFGDKEGLVNNTVPCMLEDKRGNLWVGSAGGGVSKYDGNYFSSLTDKEGLASINIRSLLQDKKGNIWFGMSDGGVSKLDGVSLSTFSTKEGLAHNTVMSILEDKLGNFWFGTYGGGVSMYNGKSFLTFTDKDGLPNNTIRSIKEDSKGNLWFGTDAGSCKFNGKSFITYGKNEGLSSNIIRNILEDKSGNIWFGTDGGVTKYNGKTFITFNENNGLAKNTIMSMLEDNSGNIWFGTYDGGVTMYDGNYLTSFSDKDGLANNFVLSMIQDKNGNIWFGTRFGLSKLAANNLTKIVQKIKSNNLTEQDVIFKNYTFNDGFLGIGVNVGKTMVEAENGSIWIGTNDRLTIMHQNNMYDDTVAPNIQITNVNLYSENINWSKLSNKSSKLRLTALDTSFVLGNSVRISNFKFDDLTLGYYLPENLSLAYNNNYLSFNFIGITMHQPKNVKYQYLLEGLDENWSALTNKNEANYGNLPSGSYIFKVKAMNSQRYWSKPFEYKFEIRPPFWQTLWFRVLIVLVIIGSIWYYIKSREKKLKQRQSELEQKIEIAIEDIREQKHLVEEKHKEITDSINYAERIQRSFLATKAQLDSNLKEYFILFKPKVVVSGDFYWSTTLKKQGDTIDKFILLTADSTGHSVAGAIMSLLNITSVETAFKDGYTQPAEILNATRKTIIERLKKDGSPDGGKDGMDCSLLSFDFEKRKLTIAAANNPVWIIRCHTECSFGHAERSRSVYIEKIKSGFDAAQPDNNIEVIEIKPDKMPVGKHDKDQTPFTQQEIQLQKGDVIYTLTDGFPDQFGGENLPGGKIGGKKFMSKNLRKLLAANAKLPLYEQKTILENTFNNWLGNNEQVDDVTIIGIRI